MGDRRIRKHPVLEVPKREEVWFTWNGKRLRGLKGEMISSALLANDIHVFGHHPKDGSPQGLFCANGQCSQCLVIANGIPVKACMTPLEPGMTIQSVEGIPELPADDTPVNARPTTSFETEVLIIGAGPAGLSAAIELGRFGVETLVVDDKDKMGGKLVLQTDKFFGSAEDFYAGTRGYEIASLLEKEISELASVRVWLNTVVVGVFSDGIVGMVTGKIYRMVKPKKLLVATGARERMVCFPGNTLPGVYGAGAFQTLVNRDLIKASNRLFIIGGSNVGLIAGYNAVQAGIEVVGLAEPQPEVGGYKVYADRLKRLGVPIFTRHTVVAAHGRDHVESVTIGELDKNGDLIPESYKRFDVDTLLIAIGFSEVNELYLKAKQWGMDVYVAGDAREIANASAAMVGGKIEGLKIARALGKTAEPISEQWKDKAKILKSKPGKVSIKKPTAGQSGVKPIFHCYQEIACNPCTSVCPENAIRTQGDILTGLPYIIDENMCKGCMSCVAVCPGLAISLVDYRDNAQLPTVTLPYEMGENTVKVGQEVEVTDDDGNSLGTYSVKKILSLEKKFPRTLLVQVQMEPDKAVRAIGIRVQRKGVSFSQICKETLSTEDAIVCRCERVTAGEIRSAIRKGVTDINQLKAITRATMGACGGKTCKPMIMRIFEEEGVDLSQVVDVEDRPLFVEVPIGAFAGVFREDTDE